MIIFWEFSLSRQVLFYSSEISSEIHTRNELKKFLNLQDEQSVYGNPVIAPKIYDFSWCDFKEAENYMPDDKTMHGKLVL